MQHVAARDVQVYLLHNSERRALVVRAPADVNLGDTLERIEQSRLENGHVHMQTPNYQLTRERPWMLSCEIGRNVRRSIELTGSGGTLAPA